MQDYQNVEHTFGPIYDKNSKILILGSFPSTSPANAAWSFERLCKVWGEHDIINT